MTASNIGVPTQGAVTDGGESGGTSKEPPLSGRLQRIGLLLGAAAFLLALVAPAPEGLSEAGWRVVAVALLMAVWWMTEAIPIEATGLIPLVLFPALGILDMPSAAAPYANELIFLFMGGFFIAVTMERWNLHTRTALWVVGTVGTGPRMLVLGCMLATGFISMWISNTAAAAMMLPIALAVGEMFRPSDQEGPYEFGVALMLGVAYAASLGGTATLVGTPPNAIMAGAASEILGVQIGFLDWMKVGLPFAALMLLVGWLLLVFFFPPGRLAGDAGALLQERRRGLGAWSRGEKIAGSVFLLTALSWILREEKDFGAFVLPGLESVLPTITDSTIAVAGALALFIIPVDFKQKVFALDWPTARKIPWGVLVLFGGGLSLARGVEVTGVAAWVGGGVETLGFLPVVVLIALIALLFLLLSELASNTATAAMAMPIAAGIAIGLNIEPLSLMAVAGLASSMGFMLPAATPPNAIVFGSGYLTIPEMVRAGFWLDLVSILVITLTAFTLIPLLGG